MPRVTCARARNPHSSSFQALLDEQQPASPETQAFWETLSFVQRQKLLLVPKKALFQKIRAQYCSRCYGLFALRYEELANGSTGDCPACQEYYAGLTVADNGSLSLSPSVLLSQPFTTFSEAKARERERELQFMTGDICGSGWQKSKGQTVCTLHTSPVPVEALLDYWTNLPEEHRSTLFSMREEDFVAELDAHMKYHLKICRDCRSNVVRAYKDLKPLAKEKLPAEDQLELCPEHLLSVADGCVTVQGAGSADFFERAEEVEDFKITDGELGDDADESDKVRHAETPELAREALVDSVVLIFKSQVEVAFREQTAGHNALLLFVHLVLQMMEEQLQNSSRELAAKQAEAELLELVAEDKKKADKRSKKKKKPGKAIKAEAPGPCISCAALQQPSSPRRSAHGSPVRPPSPLPSCRSRSASPARQSPRAQSPACPGQQPARHIPPKIVPAVPGAGWEVQARGRKRCEPARKAPGEAGQAPSWDHAPSQHSMGQTRGQPEVPASLPAAATLAPSSEGGHRLSKHSALSAAKDLPARPCKGPAEAAALATSLHATPVPPRMSDPPCFSARVKGPAAASRPAATPAIAVPSAGSHQAPESAVGSAQRPYSLWGGCSSQDAGDVSIWQHDAEPVVRPHKQPLACHRNAWAVPFMPSKQPLGPYAAWKQAVQAPLESPCLKRGSSFSLFSHSDSVSSTASLEAQFLQGGSPSGSGNYQLFGANSGIPAPLPLLWGFTAVHPLGVRV